jgi:hypothetical protein
LHHFLGHLMFLGKREIHVSPQWQFSLIIPVCLNKKARLPFRLGSVWHRASDVGSRQSWLFLDTHVAQLIRIDIRDEQVRTGEGEEQEQEDWCNNNQHVILLSISINAVSCLKLYPLTVLKIVCKVEQIQPVEIVEIL